MFCNQKDNSCNIDVELKSLESNGRQYDFLISIYQIDTCKKVEIYASYFDLKRLDFRIKEAIIEFEVSRS